MTVSKRQKKGATNKHGGGGGPEMYIPFFLKIYL